MHVQLQHVQELVSAFAADKTGLTDMFNSCWGNAQSQCAEYSHHTFMNPYPAVGISTKMFSQKCLCM